MELELQAAQIKASHARARERMLNNPIYCEEVLQYCKIKMYQKCKAIEDNPLHINARKEVNRMAKVKKISGESQEAMDTLELEEIIKKVRQRYFLYRFSNLMSFRIAKLDSQFADLNNCGLYLDLMSHPCTKNFSPIYTHSVKTLFVLAVTVFLVTLWNSK